MAAKHNLLVDQGATFKLVLWWCEPLRDLYTGALILDELGKAQRAAPISLAGYAARMHVRETIGATTTQLDLSSADGEISIPGPVVRMLGWVKAATTANIASLSGPMAIDGVDVVVGDRVLVKDQTDPADNGVYDVQTGSWTRSDDADSAGEVTDGACVWVRYGTRNSGSAPSSESVWIQGSTVTAIGVDDQVWAKTDLVGKIMVTVTDEQTELLTKSGVYDLEVESPGGEVTRIIEGKVRLSREVTREPV
jgi:hypothetical protein